MVAFCLPLSGPCLGVFGLRDLTQEIGLEDRELPASIGHRANITEVAQHPVLMHAAQRQRGRQIALQSHVRETLRLPQTGSHVAFVKFQQ